MFVIDHGDKQKFPIKVWLRKPEQVDAGCLEQALHLANLPFLHQWVTLMPDTHQGISMPIGGVIAVKDAVIPNAVGVDIGCGMAYVQTDLPAEVLMKGDTPNGKLIQAIIGEILRQIPVGFAHHQQKQKCRALDLAADNLSKYKFAKELIPDLKEGYFQVGTLGGATISSSCKRMKRA